VGRCSRLEGQTIEGIWVTISGGIVSGEPVDLRGLFERTAYMSKYIVFIDM
jgi:hypothetical protein